MAHIIWDSFHRYSKADMNSWTSFINSSVVLTSFLNNVWLGHDFERTSAKLENRPRVIRHVEHGKHPDRVSVCCSEFDCGRIRSLKNKWSVMIKTEVTLWPELDELFTKKLNKSARLPETAVNLSSVPEQIKVWTWIWFISAISWSCTAIMWTATPAIIPPL